MDCGSGGKYLVVIAQQLIKKVNSFVGDESLVLRSDEAVPRLLLEAAENVIVLLVELNLVLVNVLVELVGAEDLCNLDQLVSVALAVEEWLLAEDHRGEHGAEAPHVQAVVVLLEINQQLWALEVSRGDSDVVLCRGVVELCQTPIDETQLQ